MAKDPCVSERPYKSTTPGIEYFMPATSAEWPTNEEGKRLWYPIRRCVFLEGTVRAGESQVAKISVRFMDR